MDVYLPAAVRSAVRLLAFTMAFTAPVRSSRTSVEPGMPSGLGVFGTDTTLIEVPSSCIRAGMNNAEYAVVLMTERRGETTRDCFSPSCALERSDDRTKTRAISAIKTWGVNVAVMRDTS